MTIAFYAPLKSPTHGVPSGDRTIARALIAALEQTGRQVCLASSLRLYDGAGDARLQAKLADTAAAEVVRLIADPDAQKWQAWLTYHNYYKAPDLIGPSVAAKLGIPYIQVESTRARKRLTGPWSEFAAAAEAASDAANTIFYFTNHDAESLRRDAPDGQKLIHLAPFLARLDLPPASTLNGPMLSAGMMRPGDKLASYRIIAQTLAQLPTDLDWHLEIAGHGASAHAVAEMMAPFEHRVSFLGELDPRSMDIHYRDASLFLWPGVNEAFGMVYLEAQAAGVPVVVQHRPGVCDVINGCHPSPDDGPIALAKRIVQMLTNTESQRAAAAAARQMIAEQHLLGSAAKTIDAVLKEIT